MRRKGNGDTRNQFDPLIEVLVEIRGLHGFQLRDHLAGEAGADDPPAQRDAVPNFGRENGPPNSWMTGNQMDLVTKQIALQFFRLAVQRLSWQPRRKQARAAAIRADGDP